MHTIFNWEIQKKEFFFRIYIWSINFNLFIFSWAVGCIWPHSVKQQPDSHAHLLQWTLISILFTQWAKGKQTWSFTRLSPCGGEVKYYELIFSFLNAASKPSLFSPVWAFRLLGAGVCLCTVRERTQPTSSLSLRPPVPLIHTVNLSWNCGWTITNARG